MRLNQPVTQRPYEIPDDATLMSTTDTRSHLTYANDAFVQASGFSREDLVGQPHNIVRHPDMPPAAFADMWATLKAGEPWTALVKNRRQNGDHYWVRANAVPVVRGGRHVGYMSVRTKPAPQEIAAAEALYRDFREGRQRGRSLHKGLVLPGGWLGLRNRLRTSAVRTRIRVVLGLQGLGACAGTVALFPPGAVTWALCGLGFLGAVTACALLEWQIARPLEQMREQALRVVSGESHDVSPMDRVDEIGMTNRVIGQLGLMFRWLVADVGHQVQTVQQAAAEMAEGNMDLSGRTSQAAASVQQTAASMEQMTATVQNTAATAGEATTLTEQTQQAAAQGGRAVSEVISTMGEIRQSSDRIANIIGVIDSIAFQTNILALNAAVEAARAGEQGRGFSVVAAEVRTLAGRSAEAAREIRSLIAASSTRVGEGARLVNAAGQAMTDIQSRVERVAALMGDIGSATREQSTGISQVGQAVSHLDEITQRNAALVEETAAAADTLKSQASRLSDAVNVFKATSLQPA